MNTDLKRKSILKICGVILLAVLTVVLFLLMQFPSVGGFSKDQMGGDGIFDGHFAYFDGDYFYATLDAMSSEEIAHYMTLHIIDYFFIVSYYLLLAVAASAALPKRIPSRRAKIIGFALALIPALADFAENVTMDVLMQSVYPTRVAAANSIGVWTCLKWYTLIALVLAVVALFAVKLALALSKRKKAADNAACNREDESVFDCSDSDK